MAEAVILLTIQKRHTDEVFDTADALEDPDNHPVASSPASSRWRCCPTRWETASRQCLR